MSYVSAAGYTAEAETEGVAVESDALTDDQVAGNFFETLCRIIQVEIGVQLDRNRQTFLP
jgi:hypothetical protein